MSRPTIEPCADAGAAAEIAAAAIEEALVRAVQARGEGAFIATGGTSPGETYDRLAQAELPWAKIAVTLSDERRVPVSDPMSNEGQLRARLLVGKAAAARFIPLEEEAIAAAEPFDVALLGMGEDGHFASLFPDSPLLAEGLDPADGRRRVIEVPAGEPAPPQPRLSLTLPVIAACDLILILTRGEAKRRILETGSGLPVHTLLARSQGQVRLIWHP
ncbi:6-phosphogluconolactonase [Caulobacter ginsengisoli]|uniref:6-phosphogluconolactonase n=1 Tax=Caulobacter ginsengisoli TaxID=400775 RepID=A0ABU0IS61_9CAUL|nr:6-phosphogluconolactonase [Caulobacter ginsengisoli]MDQ0464841.1 6-phosphogluconolactonase [Caulobacter ginsengisoli]